MIIDTKKLDLRVWHVWLGSLVLFLALGWTLTGMEMPMARGMFCGLTGVCWGLGQAVASIIISDEKAWSKKL